MPSTDTSLSAPNPVLRLDVLQAPIAAELKAFDRYFREAMRTSVRLLDLILQYVLRQKGKRIRPMLVLLSAKACGRITPSTYYAAALVELLHTATLIHDDVVDASDLRRGWFSVRALWKSKIAVLVGDFLLARGLLLALENREFRLLELLSDAVRRMSEGELLQLERSRSLEADESTYYRIIADKTGSLFAASMACGAASATDDPKRIERFRRAGELLGMAFQIRDDLLDFDIRAGKPRGNDLREHKLTLPLIHALRQAPQEERRIILSLLRRGPRRTGELERIIAFAHAYGGVSYAVHRMRFFAQQALELLADLPPNPAQEALLRLVRFITERDH
ncbi:MAG: polyprenyl synthetase family protein [Bacteroidetes bacterium]|nr:polyprenyl synthetase family protein [Rhodothermia bacterium]MCS7154438.1 polyprenyl synthetase family protein [Bacteroidota bacterium]MCX7906811.1 polyprenyl synthetase family protein [Bacteroidota bacterium]MDW8136910.1 polyprenyl synthetase family protein [Bacteroidota bacterium]MDW8285220.1 polyprenyl synthetase family protein [Bacteroidota bacterium]